MYLVLFGIGLLIAAAGFVTIGFGIPINAFSLGNTLIMAGTVAVVGGLVLVGIASAIRQLNRIAEALGGRAAARHAPAPEAADSLVPPPARIQPPARPAVAPKPVEAVMPKPAEASVQRPVEAVMPRPPEPRPPEPRPASEPRFPATSSEAPGPLDWLRSKPRTTAEPPPLAAEPSVVEVPDEAPLSPRAPQRPMFSPSPASEPPAEPRAWSPGRGNGAHEPMPKEAKSEAPPAPRAEPAARMAPAPEWTKDASADAGKPAAKDAGLFDVVWPDARSKPKSGAEPARREPKPEPPHRPREERRAEPSAERPAAILKSGVIDGMAYTLYVDGSIEAELPQGTVKFASVDALRAHLEKSA